MTFSFAGCGLGKSEAMGGPPSVTSEACASKDEIEIMPPESEKEPGSETAGTLAKKADKTEKKTDTTKAAASDNKNSAAKKTTLWMDKNPW